MLQEVCQSFHSSSVIGLQSEHRFVHNPELTSSFMTQNTTKSTDRNPGCTGKVLRHPRERQTDRDSIV